MSSEHYLGKWLLQPELSIYQSGEPPVAGTYIIRSENQRVDISIQWTDSAGADHELEFGSPLDGQRHSSDAPGVSHVSYERIDEFTLDSTAYDGEQVLMYARRVASKAGDLLAVSQVFYGENGSLSNLQVYRRG